MQPIALLPAQCQSSQPMSDRRRRKAAKAVRSAMLEPLDYDNPAPAFTVIFLTGEIGYTECWLDSQPDPITLRKRLIALYREINHPKQYATREEMRAERVEAFNEGFFRNQDVEKVYG